MRRYESVIIINAQLEDKEIKDTISKYKDLMQSFSNKEPEVDDIGKRKLAYEVKKQDTGYYVVFKFAAQPENISELERQYRIDDNVLKFMTVKQDELEYDESEEEDEEEY